MSDAEKFSVLEGATIARVEGMTKGSEVVNFFLSDGRHFRLYHEQDCCEGVNVEDVAGDVKTLLDTPILAAYEATSQENPPSREYGPPDSFTWTFYTLRTVKGTVVIRWLGESNGYYSESVDFVEVIR